MSLRHLLLPHPTEKKRAKLLQHPYLLSYVFFISALCISSFLIMVSFPSVLGFATDISVGDLLRYTNERRATAGVRSVVLNGTLSRAAQAKAEDMFKNDYWAHTSPQGKEPWDFITASGYDYLYAGENLAVDFSKSKGVVDAWYESPSHKANLISSRYTDVGFAVVNGELEGRKTTLIVQMFGYPRREAAAVPRQPAAETAAQIEKSETVNQPVPAAEEATPAQSLPEPSAEGTPEQAPQQPAESPELAENLPAPLSPNTPVVSTPSVLQASAVFNASRYIAILLGFFLSLLFAIDGIYVRKYGILRVSGHTVFHVLLLILAILGIWYTNIGLVL